MASLTLTVGPVTATANVNDIVAQAVLADYIVAYGGPTGGTNQQKISWVLDRLRRHIIEVANGQNIRAQRDTAEAVAIDSVSTRDWI